MRDIEPNEFRKLLELEAHTEARKAQKEEVSILKSFYKFLTEECGLRKFDYDLVDRVVGINRVNCYSADGLIDGRKRQVRLVCKGNEI